MTSHIFGPGDSLTLWRSGRILAKGAGGPEFKSRQGNRKIGFKNKSHRETFGLRVIWGPQRVHYYPPKTFLWFIKLQLFYLIKKEGCTVVLTAVGTNPVLCSK